MSDHDRQRLDLACRALIATGYFTEDEVGDDIAPRITELHSALTTCAVCGGSGEIYDVRGGSDPCGNCGATGEAKHERAL